MLEIEITARLKTVAANVYPNAAPLAYKTPCVVYQVIDVESVRDIGDDVQDHNFITFQISISSPIYGEAVLLSRSVRNSLKSWSDEKVQAVAWIDEHHSVDTSTDTQLHRVMMFFRFECAE